MKETEKKSKKSLTALGIYIGVVAIAIIAAVIILMGRLSSSGQDSYIKKVNAYGKLLSENRIPEGLKDYRELLRDARDLAGSENKEVLSAMEERIDEASAQILEDVESRKKMLELRSEYRDRFDKLVITEELRETFDNVEAELTNAIKAYDASGYRDIKDKLEDLETNLKSANSTLLRLRKNDISNMDLSQASAVEKERMDGYSEEAQSLENEGEYKEALEVYDTWMELAREISIREPERDE